MAKVMHASICPLRRRAPVSDHCFPQGSPGFPAQPVDGESPLPPALLFRMGSVPQCPLRRGHAVSLQAAVTQIALS